MSAAAAIRQSTLVTVAKAVNKTGCAMAVELPGGAIIRVVPDIQNNPQAGTVAKSQEIDLG